MKHSLKRQLASIFVLLMAGTILLCWFLNNSFLEKFYIRKRQQVLYEAYEQINKASSSGNITSEEFDVVLQKICGRYNISMVVIDADSETVKSSTNDTGFLTRILLSKFFGERNVDQHLLTEKENYIIEITTDKRIKTAYMEMWGILDNGYLFLLRSPMEGIRDSVGISNQFLAYVGFVSVLIGAAVIVLVSEKVTKPILELTEISKRMSNLDFEAKYIGKNKNEIAVLGNHMNLLSEKLECTISELKTANNELQRDIDQKNKIDQMRKEFISNVSHELKTPIALIQGYAEGLKEGITDDIESKQYYCEVIMDEADKMNKMVKNIMMLSQLESGADIAAMERFDLVELIQNTVQSLDILLKQNKVCLSILDAESKIYVWADEFKIEEVLRNYLSNAINHCEGENIIKIRWEMSAEKIRTFVFNTGKPIPNESIELIWDKFYKVDKARTREYGGSGVGLSIVKAIMNSMNQQCGVINYEDGVEFWFELDRN